MVTVPIQLISNPNLKRDIAFDPQRLSMAPLSSGLAEKIRRYATAGHDTEELSQDELLRWEKVKVQLEKTAVREIAPAHDRINQLVLSNTYTCNMGCSYCYNELDLKPVKGSETSSGMSWETAKASIDATVEQMLPNSRLTLFFVGGEPLLERDLMERAVEYATQECKIRSVKLAVIVYTNGTLITKRTLEWIEQYGVSVVVSIDGPGILNRNRVYLSGRPTIHIVLKNVKRLRPTQSIHRVRAVSTSTTPILPLHKYLVALGFNEVHVQAMYDDTGISSVLEEDMIGLLDWWKDLMIQGTVIDIMPFSSYFTKLMARGSALGSWHPCNAGRNAMTVGPDGRIYSCHHAIEEPEFQMGHIDFGIPTTNKRTEYYQGVNQRATCNSCWAKHICGGECYHRAAAAGAGQFGTLPIACHERKSLIGLALDAFAEIAEKNPESLVRLAQGRLTSVDPDPDAYEAQDLSFYN